MRRLHQKLHNTGGLVRAALLLIIPICILAVLIAWPYWQTFHWQSQQIACNSALATARDFISIDYIAQNDTPTVDDVRDNVTEVMDGWEDLCPDGGTVYVVKTGGTPPYTLLCGLHDADTKQRTRLNAGFCLTQLQETLAREKRLGRPVPTELTATVNGKTYTATPVTEPVALYRGTDTTDGYKGTVLFYTLTDGEVTYFAFADENHCAKWTPTNGWTGDSMN